MSKSQNQSSFNKVKNAESFNEKGLQPIGVLIRIEQIQVSKKQPRRYFNPQKISELTESIKEYGILEPVIVRSLEGDKYELVAGERRYRAAKKAGLSEIPATIQEIDKEQAFELALLENMQRDDLNTIDETEGMLDLLSQKLKISRDEVIQLLNQAANAKKRGVRLTDNVKRQIEIVEKLFSKVGRLSPESFRTNRLPLLNLPEDVLEVLREGKLQYTKAKAISKLDTKNQREELIKIAIDEELPLSQIRKKIQAIKKENQNNNQSFQFKNPETQSSLVEANQLNQKAEVQYSSGNLYEDLKTIIELHSDALKDNNKKGQIEILLEQLIKII